MLWCVLRWCGRFEYFVGGGDCNWRCYGHADLWKQLWLSATEFHANWTLCDVRSECALFERWFPISSKLVCDGAPNGLLVAESTEETRWALNGNFAYRILVIARSLIAAHKHAYHLIIDVRRIGYWNWMMTSSPCEAPAVCLVSRHRLFECIVDFLSILNRTMLGRFNGWRDGQKVWRR